MLSSELRNRYAATRVYYAGRGSLAACSARAAAWRECFCVKAAVERIQPDAAINELILRDDAWGASNKNTRCELEFYPRPLEWVQRSD